MLPSKGGERMLHILRTALSQLLLDMRLADFFLSFFPIWGGTCSLRMSVVRPASQAGPMRNRREGTSVVLRNTIRLT